MPYKNNQLALDEVSNTKDCVFNDNNRSLNVTANCNTFSTIEIKNNKFFNSPIPVSDHLKVIDLNNYTEHLELINNHFYGGYSNNTKNTTYISHKILGNNLGTNHLIKSNYFFDSDKGIVTYSDEALAIAENYFNGVKKGLYISGKGQVDNNDFLNIPAAVADNLPFTVDDTYGVFAVGASPKEIILNRFSGATSSNPNQASSYCAVIEASGTAPILFFGNNTEGTDVGIQAEGVNQNLGIFCNNFSLNGIAHNKGALRVTPNTSQFTSFSTPALLRHQGSSCDDTRSPAGNEWFDHTGNKDIVLIPTTYQTSFNFNPSQGNGSTIPYFKYVAHGKDEDGSTRTVPQHNYPVWESLASNELLICALNTGANFKTSASCIEIGFGPKMLTSRNEAPNGTGTISDLLAIKTNLETDKITIESQLIDPANQKDLLNQLKEIDLRIENTIIKLYTAYKEQLNVSMSKLLLESEDYLEGKKVLMELYYQEGDFVKSRDVQMDLENLLNARPTYYYNSLEEREAKELNDLYFKQINELLIQAHEDNRSESELLEWEIYALNLIKESTLPVAVNAEKLLMLNNQEIAEHPIEKVSDLLINYNPENLFLEFDYNLLAIPNPAMTYTNVNVEVPTGIENATLILSDGYNNQGTLNSFSLSTGTNLVNINVSNLNSGMYVLSVKINDDIYASTNLIVIN